MKVSIIIPVYNQIERLKHTLLGFMQQTYSDPLEIIVVDDGSDKKVDAYVKQIPVPSNIILKVIRQQNQGRSAARNTGIKNSVGEIIIFCDADRVPCERFVELHVSAHENKPGRVVVGNVKEVYISRFDKSFGYSQLRGYLPKSRVPRYIRLLNNIYDEAGATDSHIPWMTFYSGNVSVPSEALSKSKFDEGFKQWGLEHFELGLRLFQQGYEFVNENGAENYHIAHSRERSFYKQAFNKAFSYFGSLHSKEICYTLQDFMFGTISLQEVESRIGNSKALWLSRVSQPLIYNSLSQLVM